MKDLINLTSEYIVDAAPLIKAAQQAMIQTDKQAQKAKDTAVQVNQCIKRITERVKAETKPSRDHVAQINAAFKTILTELSEAKNLIARKVLIYQNDEKRKEYREKQNAIKSTDILTDSLNDMAEVFTQKPEKKLIQTRQHIEVEITDISKVPEAFLLVDHIAIKREYKLNKQAIPGIKIHIEERPVVR